ncbi:armadillo-type protein [Ilyonectria sp. MPI-CAGE-AT-0026]|nr:armadillo-type protein [Ilyonectria sp. MPI-CAGE-AT-0026]
MSVLLRGLMLFGGQLSREGKCEVVVRTWQPRDFFKDVNFATHTVPKVYNPRLLPPSSLLFFSFLTTPFKRLRVVAPPAEYNASLLTDVSPIPSSVPPFILSLPYAKEFGNKTYKEGLYESSKFLDTSVFNWVKLTTTRFHLSDYQAVVDCAHKTNNIKDLSLKRAHIDIATELGIALAKFYSDRLIEYINIFQSPMNMPKMIRAYEESILWPELVSCYYHYDEFDNAGGIDFTKKTATVDQGANAIKQALEKEPEDAKAEDIREEQPRHDASPDHADDDPEGESSCAAVKSG